MWYPAAKTSQFLLDLEDLAVLVGLVGQQDLVDPQDLELLLAICH
jgi:hypothetical protein